MGFRSTILLLVAIICVFIMVCEARFTLNLFGEDSPTSSEIDRAIQKQKDRNKTYYVELKFKLFIPKNTKKGRKKSTTTDAHLTCYFSSGTSLDKIKPKSRNENNYYLLETCKQVKLPYRNQIECELPAVHTCDRIQGICEKDLGGKAESNIDCPLGAYKSRWD